MILCVGGTPAMQRTLHFDHLDIGEVNRAREVRVTASGKVTNAARAVTVLGGRALLLTFGEVRRARVGSGGRAARAGVG